MARARRAQLTPTDHTAAPYTDRFASVQDLCRIGSLPIIDANSCLAAARCGTSATPRPAGKLVIAAKRPPVHRAFARAPTLHLRRSSCEGISCVLAHVRAAAQNVDSRRIGGGMHPRRVSGIHNTGNRRGLHVWYRRSPRKYRRGGGLTAVSPRASRLYPRSSFGANRHIF